MVGAEKERESLSAQAHNLKTRKMVGAEKEKLALWLAAKKEREWLYVQAHIIKKRGKWWVPIRESCSSAGA